MATRPWRDRSYDQKFTRTVTINAEGKPYTVRYEAVNAMLLNEFLKEHCRGREQDRKIEQLEAALA